MQALAACTDATIMYSFAEGINPEGYYQMGQLAAAAYATLRAVIIVRAGNAAWLTVEELEMYGFPSGFRMLAAPTTVCTAGEWGNGSTHHACSFAGA